MEKQMYSNMFEEENQDFTGEEITIFKRYIEENNVYTENNFEYMEENLSYYSSRYTSTNYYSPFEMFQVNSNFIFSDERKKNIELYDKSVEWYSKTVHPEDSEYVVKEEKYIYTEQLDDILKNLIKNLNEYSKDDYQCIDLLIYYKGNIYKYLAQKNFVFTWKKNCESLLNELLNETYYQKLNVLNKDLDKNVMIILPIAVPIRQALFLGEFGFRSAIISYGRIVERILSFMNEKHEYDNVEKFDNIRINNLLGIDGVEKSIYNILFFKTRGE